MRYDFGWAVAALVLVCVLILPRAPASREHYGGPVKVIRRIPVTECRLLCDNHFVNCLRNTRLTDGDLCDKRREACYAICRYTDFDRL